MPRGGEGDVRCPKQRGCEDERRSRFALTVTLGAALAPPGSTPSFAAVPQPCRDDRSFHALDFWVGDWIVRNRAGNEVGRSHIESILGGCAVREVWTASSGGSGQSLTSYDPVTKSWRQHWIDATGSQSDYIGDVDGKDVVMTAHAVDVAGKAVLYRMRFTPLPDGRLRQFIDQSQDGGSSWTATFEGFYSKR